MNDHNDQHPAFQTGSDRSDALFQDLFMVSGLLHKEIMNLHYDYGEGELTRLHYGTLGALSAWKVLSTSDLAEKMRVARPQMTIILDKLLALGLIERHNDHDDRRRILVSLQAAGVAALREATARTGMVMKQKLASLSDSDLEELSRSLKITGSILMKLSTTETK